MHTSSRPIVFHASFLITTYYNLSPIPLNYFMYIFFLNNRLQTTDDLNKSSHHFNFITVLYTVQLSYRSSLPIPSFGSHSSSTHSFWLQLLTHSFINSFQKHSITYSLCLQLDPMHTLTPNSLTTFILTHISLLDISFHLQNTAVDSC